MRAAAISVGLALLVALTVAGPALAAARGASSLAVPIAGLGDLLGGLAHTVLGGVDWTVNVAGDFVVNLLGGIVEKLIPRSWIDKGLDILSWLVAVPDYTGRVTTPGGGHVYGFAGVNAMRGLYLWLGMAIAPLSLVYATSRSWSGQGDPPHVPLTRVLIVAVALLNYTWLWSQAVAITNQITHAILGVNAVTDGIEKMFEVLVAGAALGGLPLIGLLVMGAGALQLLALIFVKVTLILVGALVYAIGPLMIGLVATDRGNAFGRAWLTIAGGLFVLPVLWASIFAIAAVLINDAAGGASIVGGSLTIGQILGGLLIAMAAIAALWLNIKLTKGFAGLVGGQLAGLLALAGGGARALLGGAGRGASSAAAGGAASAAGGGAAASLRGFASKVGGAAAGAAGVFAPRDARGQVALSGRTGAALAGAGALARGGLIGVSGPLASKGVAAAAKTRVGQAVASSRAGSVATRAARGAQRGWTRAARSSTDTSTLTSAPDAAPPAADTPPISAAPIAPDTITANGGGRDGPGGARPSRGETPSRPAATRSAGASSRDAGSASGPSAADSVNDAARAAFAQPQAGKPTRSARHPFGGRKR